MKLWHAFRRETLGAWRSVRYDLATHRAVKVAVAPTEEFQPTRPPVPGPSRAVPLTGMVLLLAGGAAGALLAIGSGLAALAPDPGPSERPAAAATVPGVGFGRPAPATSPLGVAPHRPGPASATPSVVPAAPVAPAPLPEATTAPSPSPSASSVSSTSPSPSPSASASSSESDDEPPGPRGEGSRSRMPNTRR